MEQKAFNFREIQAREERLAPGHRMCAGCGGTITVRNVLKALHPGDKAVVGNATGCLEVSTFMYPFTAYEDSYIHNAFENAGATLSGVETAYNVLKAKGKVKEDYNEPIITITGKQNIQEKVLDVIRNAKREIYMEVWGQDFKIFEQELLNAYNRNVEIRIVGYDNLNSRFGLIFEPR